MRYKVPRNLPQRREPTPQIPCQYCGKSIPRRAYPSGDIDPPSAMRKRKYCNAECMRLAFASRPARAASFGANHYQARKLVPKGPCVRCGKPNALDVHHKDGNHSNNDPSNLERICRGCHSREHFKMGRQPSMANAKLTPEKAVEIRHLKGQMKHEDLAASMGISVSTVRSIQNGRSWKRV